MHEYQCGFPGLTISRQVPGLSALAHANGLWPLANSDRLLGSADVATEIAERFFDPEHAKGVMYEHLRMQWD
jgi:hypothetical protein